MPRESPAERKQRTTKLIAALKKLYPDATCSLDFTNPLELLVATILSAQCTDQRVNIVTRHLFAKYRGAADYAAADPKTFEQEILTTGFFRNKTKSILGSTAQIVERFGGRVPRTMDELLTLPGVARKTANVVLGNAFARAEGIAVDTHVTRLSIRLKLTGAKRQRPDLIEKDLMAVAEAEDWTLLSHLLIYHGRAVCSARKPDCDGCTIRKLCPSAGKAEHADRAAAEPTRPKRRSAATRAAHDDE
jgi:endonuclease-3